MIEDLEAEAYYLRLSALEEVVRVRISGISTDFGCHADLDIKDALFLQWQLAGAIRDYEKAAGR